MPQHKSPKKQMRADARRSDRNRARRSALRKAIREFRALEDAEARRARLGSIYSVLDKACKKGILHPNASSRLKSRLSRGLSV
jgi:small subunit ribosomal protein S20